MKSGNSNNFVFIFKHQQPATVAAAAATSSYEEATISLSLSSTLERVPHYICDRQTNERTDRSL